MKLFSLIHPSRSRADKSYNAVTYWMKHYSGRLENIEVIVSLDEDDPQLTSYLNKFPSTDTIVNKNKSSVEAINKAAAISTGKILIVIGEDGYLPPSWQHEIIKEVEGKVDWILKTQDGIQDYIITLPIMDRTYYNRTGYIYHPDFQHLFCDTYLTCVADITGRKITSNLMFKHNHYSVNGTEPDELHIRNDATWRPGQETFIRLMNQFTLEERRRIKDQSMKNWLRNKGVQI